LTKDLKKSGTQYAYAVSRIRAIEKKLLDSVKLDRMVDAKNSQEALKVLQEADYGSPSSDFENIWQYENLLKEEHKKSYNLLREIAPEPDIFDLFLLSNDYHNIKVILKAEFSGQKENNILIESGSIPVERLKAMITDRNISGMPEIMKKAVEECIDNFGRTSDPQAVDLILDKALFAHMKELSLASGSKFIKDLVTILTDLANIKIFLRVKNLNKTKAFIQKILLPGGSIEGKTFINCLDTQLDVFIDALRYTVYGAALEEGIESFRASGSLTEFEKQCDNYVMAYLKKSKYVTFGIEPLIGFLMAKETEIKNARIVMVGKLNNIPGDIIRERLREAYV